MQSIDVINQYTINLEMGGGYLVLVNYQSFLSNLFSLVTHQIFFSINCGRNRLLHVSFIKLYDSIMEGFISLEIFVYLFINSDSNLTQTQMLTLKLSPNRTLTQTLTQTLN